MKNRGRHLVSLAIIGMGVAGFEDSCAGIVWASKSCTSSPKVCTVTGAPKSGLNDVGQFQLVGNGTFDWSALYDPSDPTQQFWVSPAGPNFADNRLSQSNGDPGGTYYLPPGPGYQYISIRTGNMGAGTYSVSGANVVGDPHITTVNVVHYDFQGAGEFVLAKNSRGFEVQSRLTPVSTDAPLPPDPHTGLSSCVSLNTAAAIRAGRQRVTYQAGLSHDPDPSGMQLRVDGRRTSVGVTGRRLADGTRIFRDARTGELRAVFPDRSSVRITPYWSKDSRIWYLNYDFTPPEGTVGLIGEIAPDAWLPARSDGSSMGARPGPLSERYAALYGKFADSWRVTDATTLFDYAAGTSSKDFSVTGWPPENGKCGLPGAMPLRGVNQDVAERACAGVLIPHLKQSCVLDVMVTGDTGFGKGYQLTQGLPAYKIRLPKEKPKDPAKAR